MDRNRPHGDPETQALSDLLAEIFIVILSLVLILVIVGAVTGIIPKLLQQSALVSVKADAVTTSGGADVISLYHQQGFPVNVNGSAQAAGFTTVALTVTTPTGVLVNVRNSSALRQDAWKPGGFLYIYQSGGYYYLTDDLDWLGAQGAAVDVPPGSWKVNLIDTRVSVLLQSLPVTVPS